MRCAVFRRRHDAQEPGHLAQVERGQRQQSPRGSISHSEARHRAARPGQTNAQNYAGFFCKLNIFLLLSH